MDLSNQQSNLGLLIKGLLQPIQEDPALLIDKLPPDKRALINSFKGISALIPGFKFAPEQMLIDVLNSLCSLSDSFWHELEPIVKGAIEGDPNAIDQAKTFFAEVVVHGGQG